uniref:Uncharacterized protein n=1 Tax=Elaeophora elaphi TaxID=1147741 RepID=A0A0R3S1Q4_9BILA
MSSKRNLKNPKQKRQQQQRQVRQQQQQGQYENQKFQFQQAGQQQSTTKENEINVSSGRIGERLVFRTTTRTGQRLRYTITRPFRSAEPPRTRHSKYHHKSYSDGAFHFSTPRNFIENFSATMNTLTTPIFPSTSSIKDSSDFHDKKDHKIFASAMTSGNFDERENNEKFITSDHQNQSIDKGGDENIACCSFTRLFREVQPKTYGSLKKKISILQSETTSVVPSISRINYKTITTDSLNSIDKCATPKFERSRQKVKKSGVFYEQLEPLSPFIINDKGMF